MCEGPEAGQYSQRVVSEGEDGRRGIRSSGRGYVAFYSKCNGNVGVFKK